MQVKNTGNSIIKTSKQQTKQIINNSIIISTYNNYKNTLHYKNQSNKQQYFSRLLSHKVYVWLIWKILIFYLLFKKTTLIFVVSFLVAMKHLPFFFLSCCGILYGCGCRFVLCLNAYFFSSSFILPLTSLTVSAFW